MMGPEAGRPIPPMTEADERRFWSKVALPDPETGCMNWLASMYGRGYGRFKLKGAYYGAHRIAWALANGPIPPGMVLDHVVCRNKLCVNPEHMRVCTVRDNNMAPDGASRMFAEAQSAKTHCPQGHEYDEANTYRDPRGFRECRTCKRERDRARYLRKRHAAGAADN